MPTYEIDLPDGRSYEVDAPNDAALNVTVRALMKAQKPAGAISAETDRAAVSNAGGLRAALRGADKGVRRVVGEVKGAADTALSLASMAPAGVAYAGGTLGTVAGKIATGDIGTYRNPGLAERVTARQSAPFVRTPTTPQGARNMNALAPALESLGAVAPLSQFAAVSSLARPSAGVAATGARQTGARVADAGARAAKAVPGAVAKVPAAVRRLRPKPAGAAGSTVGAQQTDAAIRAQALANDLPVPMRLTRGMATRDYAQSQFERETAKIGEAGAPLRERMDELNSQLGQNLDAFSAQTGGRASSAREVGESVVGALEGRIARDKADITTAYNEARAAGELEAPVTLTGIVQQLNELAPQRHVAPVLKTLSEEAVRLKLAEKLPDGTLRAIPGTLNNGELWRRSINNATGTDATNKMFGNRLKGTYDRETNHLGGQLYNRARGLRTRFGERYEDVGAVRDVLGTRPGSADRRVAYEAVADRIFGGTTSRDGVAHMRTVLLNEGPAGLQAWADIQSAGLARLKNAATRGSGADSNRVALFESGAYSKALRQLDEGGKLELLYGKKGAEQLRLLGEIARDVKTAPPGSVNFSNTSSALFTALANITDVGATVGLGVPAPITTLLTYYVRHAKNAKLRARIKDALEYDASQQGANRTPPPP